MRLICSSIVYQHFAGANVFAAVSRCTHRPLLARHIPPTARCLPPYLHVAQSQTDSARGVSRFYSNSLLSYQCSSPPLRLTSAPFVLSHSHHHHHSQVNCNSLSRFLHSVSGAGSADKISAMDLQKVVSILEEFAPTNLAGSWDNVGLLVEPTPPHQVTTMCLTNDLTEDVLMEAISKKADFILAYHPPIFAPLKRLTMRSVKERIVVRAIESRMAIYSPHTSYDAVEGGVNDWLVEGFGDVQQSRPLSACTECKTTSGDDVNISFTRSTDGELAIKANVVNCIQTIDGNFQVSCTCQKSNLAEIMSAIREISDINLQSVQITELVKAPMLKTGVGRIATLSEPSQISAVVERIKKHLKLDHVQIAIGQGKTLDSMVSSVAVCAGSGASVLENVKADFYLTGEMSHHDILAAVAMGTTVVTCNHSNTERGYLHVLREKLNKKFESRVNIFVSETDRDPLQFI